MVITDALQRKRIRFLLCIFTLSILGLLIFRVGYWQIVKADWLEEQAIEQWIRELPIEPNRGDILDRNGNILAVSVSCYSVILQPTVIAEDKLDFVVANLASILEMNNDDVRKIATKDASQVWLKRQITAETADLIRELDMNGVSLTEDKMRYYPLGNFSTQVLGFTSVDGEGLEGIESRFDKFLQGIQGKISVFTDRDGSKVPGAYEEYINSTDGNNVKLTIDVGIQSFAEKALELCMIEQNATKAICIVMDPNTGKLLAIVNKPDYNNNEPPRNDIDTLRALTKNRAITDVYEPGSTFKIITTASAIDSNEVNLNTTFSCNGYRIIDGQKIKCWSNKPHGTLNLTQAVQKSCNPAFMDMALMMGATKFYDYIYDFGFGSKTGIKMYGESSGIVTAQKYIKNVDLARIGFGQAIAVTPLQLVAAASAIVNGGNLMQSRIVEGIYTPNGDVIEQYGQEIIRNVISSQTSATMRDILYAVVENGSGRYAQVEGYKVGGKTGTAQKYGANGEVLHDKHISSFIGIAPIDDPKLVILIAVDEPKAGLSYGSIVAAPYVQMILKDSLAYLSIKPTSDIVSSVPTMVVPDVIGLSVIEAEDKLEDDGFHLVVDGYSGNVAGQIPAAGTNIEKGSSVVILLENVNDIGEIEKIEVPDVFSMTPVEANDAITQAGLEMKIMSSGNVVFSQHPKAGTLVYPNTQVSVTFDYIDPPEEEDEEDEQG